ncbi:hypothetical protein R1flu_009616 [Riccia fluitans]|uniref:ATP synthase F1 complex delta/epsilon subunit N-terminal domain-containing protein n=1 Tax=Riccia fluitans TaxID=41844 RepID=A0ABD1Z2M1_9MARC
MVMIPASTGIIGILPGYVPTVVEMKPGLLSVQNGGETTKYVVSGGYAFLHANSVADIVALDAYPPENFDIEEAKKGLADFTAKLNSANTELEKAQAQIAVDTYSRVMAALS